MNDHSDVPDVPAASDGPDAAGSPSPRPDRHRSRTVVASVVGVVAVLVLSVTIVAVWAKATVLRSEPIAELAGDALAEPEVQAALAAYLADQVAAAVDLEPRLVEVLPDALDRFAGVIAGAANAGVERALTRALGNDDLQQALVTIIERAHDRAMRVLEGDGLSGGITISDGQVSLNLLPLVGRGLTSLQAAGLLQDLDVPVLTVDGDPDEQIAELSSALGRDLPAGFGQLVVYESDKVADGQAAVQSAQRMLTLAERAVWVLVVLSLVLIAATMLIAARRWRAALVLGLGTAATMIVLRSAVRRVVDEAPDLVRRPGAKAALDAILRGASASLLALAGVVLLVALLVIAVAVLRGRWRDDDLVLVAAVLVGAVTVALLGASLLGLVVGIVVGVGVVLLARWLLTRRDEPAPATP
ncbi:MAG: hypothetical protein ABW122_05555 [Ilumatobacteraceae bacterium]